MFSFCLKNSQSFNLFGVCILLNHTKCSLATVSRENTKEKDKTEGTAEETEEREQATPGAGRPPIARAAGRAGSPGP